MSDQKVLNRWVVVAGAILIQLCLGAIYAWSVFTKLLTIDGGDYGFTAKQAAWVFSIISATRPPMPARQYILPFPARVSLRAA